jgi:hypothetical protein
MVLEGRTMKRTIVTLLVTSIACFLLLSTARSAQAQVTDGITRIEWLKDVRSWKGTTDLYLGFVNFSYITGSQWILNIYVTNTEENVTHYLLDVAVYRIGVWFDWNMFYNTTFDPPVTIKNGSSYLFSVNNTTESALTASNLFTHDYKVYVEFEVSYLSNGASITEERTWTFSGVRFAVLSQDQYDAAQAAQKYLDFKAMVGTTVTNYTDSLGLMFQAEQEYKAGRTSYIEGDFSGAGQHYNAAYSLLSQSWTTYMSKQTELDDIRINQSQANLDMILAQIDAVKANTTATLVEANAIATATVVNSIGFALFGLGFMFFGVAAIFYARRPKPAPT